MEDRLQKFVRLVEIGSFTRAARELHISQPALTIAINKLEQELGTALLIRGNRQFEITEAGRAAYQAARAQKNAADDLHAELRRIANKRPSVTLGMTDSIAAVLCASSAFDMLESAADVTIIVNNSRYLRNAVLLREVDVAFVIDGGLGNEGLQKTDFGQELLCFVCSPSQISAVEQGLCHNLLNTFISYDKPSTTYRIVQQALTSQGIKAHTALYSTSPDVMLQMVLRGRGVAALPQYLVNEHLQTSMLMQVTHLGQPLVTTRQLCGLRLTDRVIAPCLTSFILQAGAIVKS